MGIKFDRKTNLWVVSYIKRHPVTRVPRGLKRIGIETKAEAKRVYAELVFEVEQKIRAATTPTWGKLVKLFLAEARASDFSQNTVANYEANLMAHTFADWENRLCDSIAPQEIRELIRAKVGLKSPNQQRNLLKYIRGVFNFGVETGTLKNNPTPQMKIKLLEKVKKVLTSEQVRLFLNKAKECDHEWYGVWALALYSGMRSGELYALKWDKVDFETKRIVVDSSWTDRTGFKSTKSGHERHIEIAPPLLTVLKELKLQSMGSIFVLPRLQQWERGEQARELQKFLLPLGLPLIRFHDLRATWCTILLGMGIEPVKIMRQGGWRDLKTLQIYHRLSGIDTRGSLNNLILHEPSTQTAKVLNLGSRSES